jgi:endonuclease/exonuclease/phosphatase family metal-dependent hydrolase
VGCRWPRAAPSAPPCSPSTARRTPPRRSELRVATLNLLHGRSVRDGQVDLDRVRDAIAGLDADVLALQEADRDQPRSFGADLTALAAEALGAEHWRFEPALWGTPGESWRAAPLHGTGPAYGVGLVSRLPVQEWSVVRLAAAPVRSPVLAGRRVLWLTDEPRVGLTATVDGIAVTTTHLSFVPGWNAVQLRRLLARLEPGPGLLLGDLNLPGAVPSWLAPGWRALARAATWPAPAPRVQLDHVLGRGDLPAVTAVEAVELPFSDHRALVIDLR